MDCALLELGGQRGGRRGGLGEQEDAAGADVEPVHGSDLVPLLAPRALLRPAERAAAIARERALARKTGGLVDHEQRIVLEEDPGRRHLDRGLDRR